MATELPLLTGPFVYLICAAFGGPRRPPVAPLHLAAEWRANEILRSRIIPPAPGTPESPGGLGTRSEPGTWGAGPRAGAGTLFPSPSTHHPPLPRPPLFLSTPKPSGLLVVPLAPSRNTQGADQPRTQGRFRHRPRRGRRGRLSSCSTVRGVRLPTGRVIITGCGSGRSH